MKAKLVAVSTALIFSAAVSSAQIPIDKVVNQVHNTIEIFHINELKFFIIKDLKQIDAKTYSFIIDEYSSVPDVPEFEGTNSKKGTFTLVDSVTLNGAIISYKDEPTEFKLNWKNGQLCYAYCGGNGYSVRTDENGVVRYSTGYGLTPDNIYERYETSINYDVNGRLSQLERYAMVAKPKEKLEEEFRYIRNRKIYTYNSENSTSIHTANYFWKTKKRQKDEVMNNWKETYVVEGGVVKFTNGSQYTVDDKNRVLTSKEVLKSGKLVNSEYSRNSKGWISKRVTKTTTPEGNFLTAEETEYLYEVKENADPNLLSSYKIKFHRKSYDESGKLIFERLGDKTRKLLDNGEMSDWQQVRF